MKVLPSPSFQNLTEKNVCDFKQVIKMTLNKIATKNITYKQKKH